MATTYSVYLGRFQPFHNGHLLCVKEALKHSDKLLLIIGSAQENRTQSNPLSYLERRTIIENILTDENIDLNRVTIVGLEDIKALDIKEWGDYLYYQIVNHLKTKEFTYVCSLEYDLSTWFNEDILSKLNVVYMQRSSLDVSATKVRKAIMEDDLDYLQESVGKYILENYLVFKGIICRINKC